MKIINFKYSQVITVILIIIVLISCTNQKNGTLKDKVDTYLNLSKFNIYLYLMEESEYTAIGNYDDEIKTDSWLYESREGTFNVEWNIFEDSTLRFNIPDSWILDKKYAACSFTDTITNNAFIFLHQELKISLIDYLSDYYTSASENYTIIEKKATRVIVNDDIEFIVLEFKLENLTMLATLIRDNNEIFDMTFFDNTSSEQQKIIYAEIINTITIEKNFIIPNQTSITKITLMNFE